MTRVIGPPKSTRRKWTFLCALLVMVGFGVLFIPGALAVHDTGLFQLDGDASSSVPAGAVGDDWDHVCHQVLGTDCSTSSNTTAGGGAVGVDFTAEPNLNSSIFTGGGSKDPIDISSWAWKDGAGGLPDKDNLLHEFAARYTVDSNSNCPGVGGETAGATKCDVLFFGSDRYDNSGDAQQGFWFFQNKITLGSNSVGGGSGFSGVHKLGDILVISDFSNGGATSSITVLKWDPACTATNKPTLDCADGNLRTLGTNATAKCTAAAPHDAFCGLVNPATTTMPWSFTDKSGTAGNGALNGEFYEGGINLSAFNLGGECFSSVAAETRSSTSTTAVLKDFVLGGFGQCNATFATTPSGNTQLDGVSGSVKVHDTASIGVTGLANPPAPTGSVKFYLCGPSATALTSCDANGSLKNTVDLVNATKSGSSYSIGSGDVTLTASGYYCWFASWPGDTNYNQGPYSDGSSTECFSVSQPTSVSTTLHETDANGADVNPANNGTTITINNDSHVVDYATVAPTAATGSVSFRYYSAQAVCLADDGSGGTSGGTGTVSSGSAHGSTLQPASGTYYFRAFFTGTGLFLNSSSDCGEVLTVNSFQPSLTSTQTVTITDAATVSASGGGSLNGTLHFQPFSDSGCSTTSLGSQVDVGVSGASPQSRSTTTTLTYTTNGAHPVYWKVSYSSNNPAQKDIAAACSENTAITIAGNG
jgi:hypothetical protein